MGVMPGRVDLWREAVNATVENVRDLGNTGTGTPGTTGSTRLHLATGMLVIVGLYTLVLFTVRLWLL